MRNIGFFTTTQAAKLLGISRVAVFKRIKSGAIKAEKIGRSFAIPKRELAILTGATLTQSRKEEIEQSVKKTVLEYGEALKLLGKE